jgi:hypothetical protein
MLDIIKIQDTNKLAIFLGIDHIGNIDANLAFDKQVNTVYRMLASLAPQLSKDLIAYELSNVSNNLLDILMKGVK